MPVRDVSDNERKQLMRRNLTNAAEIVETFKALIEDSINYDRDKALEMLDELLNCIHSANADVEPVEDEFPLLEFHTR